MSCPQIQSKLSLYLYGELDFASEEVVEEHLLTCAFCQQALAREKSWHATLNAQQTSVPLDLLAECRKELSEQVAKSTKFPNELLRVRSWRRWWDGLPIICFGLAGPGFCRYFIDDIGFRGWKVGGSKRLWGEGFEIKPGDRCRLGRSLHPAQSH